MDLSPLKESTPLLPVTDSELTPLINHELQANSEPLHKQLQLLHANEVLNEHWPILKAGTQVVVIGTAATNYLLAGVVQDWKDLPPWLRTSGSVVSVVVFFFTEVALGFATVQDEWNTWSIRLSKGKTVRMRCADIGWAIARGIAVLAGPFVRMPMLYFGSFYNGGGDIGFSKGLVLALAGAFEPIRGMYLMVKAMQAKRQRRTLNESDERVMKAKEWVAGALRRAELSEDQTLNDWLMAQIAKAKPKAPLNKRCTCIRQIPGYATAASLLTFVGTLGYYGGKVLARKLKRTAQIAVGVTTSAITTVGHAMLSWEYVKKVPQMAASAIRDFFKGKTGLSGKRLALIGGTVVIAAVAQLTTTKEVSDAYPSPWARIPQLILMPAASLFLNSSALAEGINLASQRIGIARGNPQQTFNARKAALACAVDQMDLDAFRNYLYSSPQKVQLVKTFNLQPADISPKITELPETV